MSSLYFDISDDQWPIVYDKKYNVSFFGLERVHVFDSKKWGNIIKILKEEGLITESSIVKPKEATEEHLLLVHTKRYLNSLNWSYNVALVAEVAVLCLLPNCVIQKLYLKPMRLQTGGSVLAGKLALDRGWAINVGGGFHHCSGDSGGGFCPYADITLLIKTLMGDKLIKKAMIVDLDAHQGNGYQHDFLNETNVYIVDVFNKYIYPRDKEAKTAINKMVELKHRTEDLEYMLKVRKAVKSALGEFKPDLLVYNAGTDVLENDPLGNLRISKHGITARDQFIFETCKSRNIPVVMLTSGGYQRSTARVIADSIINLYRKELIGKPFDANNRKKPSEFV